MKTQRKPERKAGNGTGLTHHVEAKIRFQPVNPWNFLPESILTDKFTVAEHLRVQRKIERRAQRLWFLNGYRSKTPLCEWLQAENQVLTELIEGRMHRHLVAPDFGWLDQKASGRKILILQLDRIRN